MNDADFGRVLNWIAAAMTDLDAAKTNKKDNAEMSIEASIRGHLFDAASNIYRAIDVIDEGD